MAKSYCDLPELKGRVGVVTKLISRDGALCSVDLEGEDRRWVVLESEFLSRVSPLEELARTGIHTTDREAARRSEKDGVAD